MKKKNAEIHIYLSAEQKEQITRRAELCNKKRSEFILEAALTESEKIPAVSQPTPTRDYSADLEEIKKQLYIIARLVLFSASAEQRHSEENVIDFYQTTAQKAEKIFGEKGVS